MTISVSVFDKAEIKEDQKTEFKTSIFVDPEKQQPGFKQMMTIAETLAAFMNAEGGMLYVGIADNKDIRGIEDDLAVLANQANAVTLHTPRGNDEGHDYKGTTDKYELKIRAIVKACLSPNASDCLGNINFGKMGQKTVCRIEAKPCKPDDYVYAYLKYSPTKPEIAEIFKRFGNQKRKLEGVERDEFVRERTRRQVVSTINATAKRTPAELVEKILEAINDSFSQRTQVVGGAFVVEGAVSLADPNFAALAAPKGFVFDGQHVCDVKTWKDAYGALLVKLNKIDSAKFDGIVADPFFKKWFVEVQPHKKYGDYFKDKLGTAANVRGYVKVGKVHFIKPDYIVHKLLSRFGIEPSRVSLRG